MTTLPTPTPRERYLVYRCLLTQGVLIGNENEIWTSGLAYRTLITLRMCIDAISQLVQLKQGVYESYIKSVVMQTDGMGEVPFCLDEMAEFLLDDREARNYWDSVMITPDFPVRCPLCKTAAAYVSLNFVECKGKCDSSS